jgi:hypothetical protein
MRDTTTAPKRKPITKVKGWNKHIGHAPGTLQNLLAIICSQKGKNMMNIHAAARIAHAILLQQPLLAQ